MSMHPTRQMEPPFRHRAMETSATQQWNNARRFGRPSLMEPETTDISNAASIQGLHRARRNISGPRNIAQGTYNTRYGSARGTIFSGMFDSPSDVADLESIPARSDRLAPARLRPSSQSQRGSSESITRSACAACSNDFPSSELAVAPCCHRYCRKCLDTMFTAALASETSWPLRCCNRPVPADNPRVRGFVGAELLERYQVRKAEMETKDRTYCHEAPCSRFIPPANIEKDIATCPGCGSRSCAVCKGAAHEGRQCPPPDGDLKKLMALAERRGWRRCAECRRMIERTDGCSHISECTNTPVTSPGPIQCSHSRSHVIPISTANAPPSTQECICGADICYLCGKTWAGPRVTWTCPCSDQHRRGPPGRLGDEHDVHADWLEDFEEGTETHRGGMAGGTDLAYLAFRRGFGHYYHTANHNINRAVAETMWRGAAPGVSESRSGEQSMVGEQSVGRTRGPPVRNGEVAAAEHQECSHDRWWRRPGPADCTHCGRTVRSSISVCHGCGIMACPACICRSR